MIKEEQLVGVQQLVEMRREFHQIAETGWLEFETTIKIIDYLKSFGYDIEYGKSIHSTRMGLPSAEEIKKHAGALSLERDYDIEEILQGYTGAVATLDTGRAGPTVAMRFDIDANGVEELKTESHKPAKEGFISRNKNTMHACGHDGHISIGLSIAEWIMNNKDDLKGKYIIIFQPAEEGVRGAKSLVGAGVLHGTDYLLSGHIGMGVENGKLVVGTLGFLATTKLDIYFEGEPSHAGASPELGKNALLAASSCALNLHTLPQFGAGMSRLNVGTLVAGTGRNVVPSKAKLEIETRGENEEVNELLKEKVKRVIEGSAAAFDVKYRIELAGGAPSYPKYNKGFIDEIKKYLENDFNLTVGKNLGGSEDVTYMMNEVERQGGKSVYFMFGTDLKAPHHNNKFDFDEEVLLMAHEVYIKTIEMLNK